MAPYVVGTATLQRPMANRRIRRATARHGIDEYFPLDVNGYGQWLRIRGERADNPLILYLHGGPGGSQIPSYRHYQLRWERAFTIVHWEQRGAGKSYGGKLNPATLTLSQLVADALEVIRYLADRFNGSDIVLLGHSWGSLLGIHVLQRRPARVSAYVGVGQVANQIESESRMHEFALQQAVAAGDGAAIKQLTRLQGYPLAGRSFASAGRVRRWARHYGFLGSAPSDTARTRTRLMDTPEYGLTDVYRFLKGSMVSFETLGRTLLTEVEAQPAALPLVFDVPIFLISGRRDHFTPADLADDYLSSIHAPAKRHIVFRDSGHYPHEDQSDRFIGVVDVLVRPYLAGPHRLAQHHLHLGASAEDQ